MSRPGRGKHHDWRAALARFVPAAAGAPVTLHAAQLLLARGLNAEAEAALREFLVRSPDHHPALLALGLLLRRVGRGGEADEFLARAARIEAGRLHLPTDDRREVERFLSAADRCGPTPAAAPPAFVAALFDESADRFDSLLCEQLAYRGPELLLGALTRVAGRELRDLDVLDLGCGTGLAGELFRPLARRLDGVDLSPGMLARAGARGVYDRLAVGDVVEHLDGTTDRYDLLVAADVFVYLGDLAPVMRAARRVLRAGGWLAFTVEAGEEADYHLQSVRRYAHSRDYLTRTAGASGYDVRCLDETSTRIESLRPVRSFVCVLGLPEEGVATAERIDPPAAGSDARPG